MDYPLYHNKLFYQNELDASNGTGTDILRTSILQLPGHTGTQPRERGQLPPPGEGVIGFTENFMMGNTFADTYQNSKEYNMPVMMENREAFGKLYAAYKPDVKDEKEIDSDYAAFQNMYSNNYLKGVFDPYDFNGVYDFSDEPQKGFRIGMQKWHPLDKRFDMSVNPTMQDIPGMEKSLPFQEAQDYALNSGWYIDKHGKEVPNFMYDHNSHNSREIRWKQDSLTGDNTPYFVEIQDGALVTKHLVEPGAIWGPKKLHSSIVGSIIRGAHSGLVIKTAKAGEALMGMIYDLSQINEPYNGNLEKYYGKSWLGRSYVNLQNWTNINAKQNYDETQGFFDDWNSALYSVFDVMGQAAIVYLTSGIGGALKAPQMLAVQASLGVGALTSVGMRREELLDKGYDVSTSNALAGFYGLQTYLSENIFRTNLIARQGFIAGRKATTSVVRKNTQQAFKNELEKSGFKGVVGKTKLNPVTQMKRGKGLLGATWGRVATLFGNVSEKTVTGKGAKAWFIAKRAVLSGGEETLEEMFENVTNIGTGIAVNNYWVDHARNVRRRYGASDYQKRTNPLTRRTEYTEVLNGSPMTTINEDDYNAIQRSLTHADDIISGKSQMDTNWHSDEFYAAFIGSALMGGAGSIFTYNNGKDKDIQLHAIGLHLYQNPGDKQNIMGAAKDMISSGEIAPEEGEVALGHFEQSIDFFVDYYTRTEKEHPGILAASGHDKSILYDFYRLSEKKRVLGVAQKTLESGTPLAEAEGLTTEFPEIISQTSSLTDEKIKEDVTNRIKKIDAEMELYKSKTNASYKFDGADITAGKSLIYSKNFTDVMGYKKQINFLADARAKASSGGIRTEIKKFFLGEIAEKKAYDKAFAREKKLLLNSGDLLHYINLQNQLTGKNEFVFELSEKYDYFRDNVHKAGFQIFMTRHNSEIEESLKYYNQDRVNEIIQDTEAFLDTEIKYKDNEGGDVTTKVRDFLKEMESTDDIEGKLNSIYNNNSQDDSLGRVLSQIKNIHQGLEKLTTASRMITMSASQTESIKRNSSEVSKLYQGVVSNLAKSVTGIELRLAERAKKGTAISREDIAREGNVRERFRQGKALKLDTIDIDPAKTGDIKPVQTIDELLKQNPTALKDYSIWAAYLPSIAKMSDGFKVKAIALLEGLLANNYINKVNNNKSIVQQAFENLENEISNTGAFSNPKALQYDIDFMMEMLDYIEHYMDMNIDLFQNDFEKDQKYKEHSRLQEYFKGEGEIANRFPNEMTRLNPEEQKQAKELIKAIRYQLTVYSEDERFNEVNREAGNVKVWIARVARAVDMVNDIIEKNLVSNSDVKDEITKKMSSIDDVMEKYKPKNYSETDESVVWKLDEKFRKASEEDKLQIQQDLALINQAIVDVRSIISGSDSATKDIDKYITSIADAYKDKTKNSSGIFAANPYGKEVLYNKSSEGYSALVSPKTYNEGRDILFDEKSNIPSDNRNSVDYFVNTSYIFFKGIVAENSGEFTAKDATVALEEILLEENKSDNKMSPVETWEQINTLTDALVFVGDTDNRMGLEGAKYKGILETTIRRAMSVSGYGGTGKEMPVDTDIICPDGIKKIGDILPGDYVMSPNGKPVKVNSIHPQGIKQAYKLTFRDGSNVECGIDHIWTVWTHKLRQKGKAPVNKTLREILDDKLLTGKKDPVHKYFIPLTSPLEYKQKQLPIDAYTLGAFIGDGTNLGQIPSISNAYVDSDIIDNLKIGFNYSLFVRKKENHADYTYQNHGKKDNPLGIGFKKLGLNVKSPERFIPEIYLQGSIGQRIALLRGLMDTDGTIRNNRVSYSTSSQRLRDDVIRLVQSLGGTAILRAEDNRSEKTSYTINIKMFDNPFKIFRKASEWKLSKKAPPSRALISIEETRMVEQVCISIDSEDGLYLAKDFIVTHNTEVFTGRLLQLITKITGKPLQITIITPNNDVANKHKNRIDAINGSGTGTINVHYVKAWEIIKDSGKDFDIIFEDQDKKEKTQIVFVEEYSLYDITEANIFKNHATKQRNIPFIFIGDTAQTPNITSNTPLSPPIDTMTLAIEPLTEPFRTGYVGIYMMSEIYRLNYFQIAANRAADYEDSPGKWKYEGEKKESNKHGGEYYPDTADGKKAVEDAFLIAAKELGTPKPEDILLVVSTYEDFERIKKDIRFKSYLDNVRVLQGDATIESTNPDLQNKNVSGIDSLRVYSTTRISDVDNPLNYFAMMVTAVSRTKQFVAAIGDIKNNDELSGDSVMASYTGDVRTQEQQVEYRGDIADLLHIINTGEVVERQPEKPTIITGTKGTSYIYDNRTTIDSATTISKNITSLADTVSKMTYSKATGVLYDHVTDVIYGKNISVEKKTLVAKIKTMTAAMKYVALPTKENETALYKALDEYQKYVTVASADAYIETVLKSAEGIFGSLNLDPEITFVGKTFGYTGNGAKKGVMGTPLAVTIVGYKNTDKGLLPIVDIVGIVPIGTEEGEMVNITPERLLQYGYYINLMEKKGMLVNDVALAIVNTVSVPYYKQTIRFSSDEMATFVEQARQENDNFKVDDPTPFATQDELYSIPRIEEDLSSVPYEYGQHIRMNNNKTYAVNGVVYLPGEEEPYLEMFRMDGTELLMKLSEVQSNVIHVSHNPADGLFMDSANRHHDNSQVYSNIIAIPMLESVVETEKNNELVAYFNSIDNFYQHIDMPNGDGTVRKGNKWFAAKRFISLQAGNMSSSVSKIYHRRGSFYDVEKKGWVEYEDVFVNRLTKGSMEAMFIAQTPEFIKYGYNSAQELIDDRLDYLSFDGHVDYQFDTTDKSTFLYTHPNYEKFFQQGNNGISDVEMEAFLRASFKASIPELPQQQGDTVFNIDNLVEFNMYKLRLIREARKLPGVETSPVTLTTPTAINGPVVKIPLSNRNDPIDLRTSKTKIEKDGYVVDLGEWTDDVKPFSGKKRILVEVKDGYSKTTGWIAVYPYEIKEEDEMLKLFASMHDEINRVRNDIAKKDFTIAELRTRTGRKNRRSAIYDIINSLSGKEFIEHNKGAIARIDELKGIADIESRKEGKRQVKLHGKSGLAMLNSLQATLTELSKQWIQTKGNEVNNRIRFWKVMFRVDNEKNERVLIEENLYTYTDKVFAPRPYLTPIDVEAMKGSTNTTGRRVKRDVDELDSMWNDTPMATGVNFDVEDTDTDTVIRELSEIMGADIMYDKHRTPLRFQQGPVKTINGQDARGLVRDGLIKLGMLADGKVKGKVHYHEAIHFILEYMSPPTEAIGILNEAKKILAKKKGKDISDITFRQAHEYLAEMYEVHRYLKVPSKGLIGKFINFVKRIIFRLGSINGGVASFFQNVDEGYFVGRDVSNQGLLGLELASVNNDYTNEKGAALIARYFKNHETADFILNYIMAPGIKELSRYGKGVLVSPASNPTMYDSHDYDKNWLEAIHDYHQSASLRFQKNDRLGKHSLKINRGGVSTLVNIGSLTSDDIVNLTSDLKLNQQGRLTDEKKKNLYLLGLYSMRAFYQEPELYYTLVQKMFPGIDLYQAVHDNPDAFNNWMSGSYYGSDYEENPSKEVNNFLKTIFETTQLYSYVKKEPIAFSIMSWPIIEELVYQAKETILNNAEEFNINTLVKEFVQMLDMITSPNRKNHLYTFIIEYGQLNPLTYGTQLNLNPDEEGYVDTLRNDYFTKADIVMAKGYAYLSMRDNVLDDPDLKREDFSDVRNAIIDRRSGYEDIISKIESHFLSYTDNAIVGENTLAIPQLTKLTHNAGNISKANLREGTNRHHYELDDATVKNETIRMLTGKDKRYKVGPSGIEVLKVVEKNKVWENVFSGTTGNQIKNVQAVLQDIFNYSFSEQVVKNSFFKSIYKNGKKTKLIGVQREQGYHYDTRKHLEMLLGSLYVSAIQTQLSSRKKTKIKSEIPNAKNVMEGLKQFYTDNGYSREVSDEEINPEAISLDGQTMLYPPQPRNMWRFFDDVLAYNIEFNEDVKTKKMTNMQGKIVATLTLVTTMLQTGRAMDFRNRADMPYVERLKNQMLEHHRRGMVYTKQGQQPLYEFDKFGNVVYRNALLNGTIKYDKIYEYINKTGEFSTVDVNKLTKYDIYRTLYEWTRNNFISKGGISNLPVMLDIYSDRPKLWFTEWFSKDGGIFYKREMKGKGKNSFITSILPQYQRFESMLNDIYSYGKSRRSITLNKWTQVTGLKYNEVISKDKVDLITRVYVKLEENKDYITDKDGNIGIGNGFHQPTNALLKVPQKTWDSLDAKGKYDKILEIHSSEMNEMRSISDSSGFMVGEETKPFTYPKGLDQDNLELRLDKIEQIADEKLGKIPEVERAYKSLVTTLAELRFKDLTQYDVMEVREMMMDVTSSVYVLNQIFQSLEMEIDLSALNKAAYSLRDSVVDNSVLIEKQSRAMSEVMFMSHYVFNNSYSALNRGPYEAFSNLTDYFKRGLGHTAPGEVYNNKLYEDGQMSAIVLEDEKTTNRLFGDEFENSVKITDGGNLINPISHRLLAKFSGGKLSNIGKGAVKNVTYYFNPVTGRLIYDKSAQMPINESKLTDNFYRSAMYAMLTPELRKGNLEKRTVYGKTTWSGALVEKKGKAWDDHINSIVNRVQDNPSLIREVITKPDGTQYIRRMADVIIHHSSLKAGGSNIGTYETGWQTPEGGNIVSGMRIYEDTVEQFGMIPVPLEFIKLQNNASKDVFESSKTIPTQLLSVIGAGSAANNARGKAINDELAKIIDAKAKEYNRHIKTPSDAKKFLRDLTSGIYMQDRESKKIIALVENKDIDPITYRNKALGEMIKDVSSALRPTLPGVNMVQMPALETIFEFGGRAYTNIEPSLLTNKGSHKITRRKLSPMKYYYSDGEKLVAYTNKNHLIADSRAARAEALKENPDMDIVDRIHIRPAEIISPFIHAKRFGISKYKSLNKLMTIRTSNEITVHGNKVKYFNYRTSLDKYKHNNTSDNLRGVEKGRGATPGIADMLVGLRMDEFQNHIDEDVYKYTLNEATKFAAANKREVDVDDMIESIAGYFTRLNYALDTFNVRIPTTNASSGFVGRIIEFVWDYDNTIFVSPDKNILDGSDFDIDELHQYVRPMIFGDSKEALVKSQNEFFDNVWDYYFDSGNAEYMTENVSPDELTRYYQNNQPKDLVEAKQYQATLGLVLEERKRQVAGKKLVGHFANLETAYLKLMTINSDKRKEIFTNASLVGLNTDTFFSSIVKQISILINGGADNSKLGGVLGKLNISEESSSLVSGMLFSGITGDALYERLNTSTVKDIVDKMYKSKTIRKNNWRKGSISMYIGELLQSSSNKKKRSQSLIARQQQSLEATQVELEQEEDKDKTKVLKDKVKKIKQSIDTTIERSEKNTETLAELQQLYGFATIGEQVRRISDIISVPSRLRGHMHSIDNNIRNIENALGTNIENVINIINEYELEEGLPRTYVVPTTEKQALFALQKNTNYKRASDRGKLFLNSEKSIRDSFNLWSVIETLPQLTSYIKILYSMKQISEQAFDIYGRTDEDMSIKNNLQNKSFFSERDQNNYDFVKTDILIGQYLNEYHPIKLIEQEDVYTYSMQSAYERKLFATDFYEHVQWLKTQHPNNSFLNNLNNKVVYNKQTGKPDFVMMQLKDSYYIDSSLLNFLIQHFNELPPKEKEHFRIYNMIMYGFDNRSGSLNEVIGTETELDFSNWLNATPRQKYFGYKQSDYVSEVYTRMSKVLPGTRRSNMKYYTKYVKGYGSLVMRKATGDYRNDIPQTLPYTPMINTLGTGKNKSTIFPYPYGASLDVGQMDELREKGSYQVSYVKPHGQWKQSTHGTAVKVIMPDGNTAFRKVTSEFDMDFTVKGNRFTKSSTVAREQYNQLTGASAQEVVGFLKAKINKAFPNIDIVELYLPETSIETRLGWIENGKINLNMRLIQPNTPFHELSHIYMGIIKETNPKLYKQLLDLAKQMLNSSHPTAVGAIQNMDNSATMEDKYDEIVAQVLGWTSEDMVIADYYRFEGGEYVEKGTSFYNRVKDVITSAVRAVTRTIANLMGIKISPQKTSFKSLTDFSSYFVRQVMKGNVISEVSSYEVSKMEHMLKVKNSTVPRNSISSLEQLNSQLGLTRGNLSRDEMIVQMGEWADYISRNANKVPRRFFGHDIKFTEEELKDFSEAGKLWSTTLKILERSDVFPQRFRAFLQGGDFIGRQAKEKLFGIEGSKTKVSNTNLTEVLQIMGYKSGYNVMTLAEATTQFGITLDNNFEGFNPLVQVELENNHEIVISLYDVTSEVMGEPLKGYDTGTLFKNLGISQGLAKSLGVTLTNTRSDIGKLNLALTANYLMASDKRIKIRQVGVIGVRIGSNKYDGVNMGDINMQIKSIGRQAQVQDILKQGVGVSIASIFSGKDIYYRSMDWLSYMFQYWAENTELGKGYTSEHFTTLDTNDKIRMINDRINALLEKAESGQLDYVGKNEIIYLNNARTELASPKMYDDQVNYHSKMSSFEKAMFDTASLTDPYAQRIKHAVEISARRVVRKVTGLKKTLEPVFKEFTSRAAGLIGDPTFTQYGVLFDTIKDTDGNQRYTGLIHHTDVILDTMTQVEKEHTLRTREKLQKGLITREDLKNGAIIVKVIEEAEIEFFRHKMNKSQWGGIDRKTKKPYSPEELLRRLKEQTSYVTGMLPVTSKTANEKLARGNLSKWISKKVIQMSDVYNFFEEDTSAQFVEEQKYITSLGDGYFTQLGWGNDKGRKDFGSGKRMNKLLGLSQERDMHGNKIYKTVSAATNNDISMDIQHIMNYFLMSTYRIIEYENYALPAINATKFQLETEKELMKVNNDVTLKFVEEFTQQAVLGKTDELGFSILGLPVDKTLQGITAGYIRPLIMAFNPSVAIVSATANFMRAQIEAVAHSMSGSWQYKPQDLVKASALFFSDFDKVTQLGVHYGVVSMSEYDLLNLRIRQVGRRNLFDSFISNFTNFSTDFYARTVIMTAQMIRDGSYDAHTVNKDGEITYDETKDKQYENRKTDSKQQVLYENMKERLIVDGVMKKEDTKLLRGYDDEAAKNFKYQGDKIVGAFDAVTKNMLNNHALGRVAMVFYNWTSTVISGTFGKGGFTESGGRWQAVKNDDGKYVAKWEKQFVGGWLEGLARYSNQLIRTGKTPWKDMTSGEKEVIHRAIINLAGWGFLMASYVLFKKKCANGECKVSYDWRVTKAAFNAMDNLFIVPSLYEWGTSPFAIFGIIRNGFVTAYGEWNVDPLYFIPGLRLYKYTNEIYSDVAGEDLATDIYEEITE